MHRHHAGRHQPHRQRGLRSKPFDAEGLANRSRRLSDDGVLTTWVLDLASATRIRTGETGDTAL